jgi:beta-galactosidase/beta-glucuronidase
MKDSLNQKILSFLILSLCFLLLTGLRTWPERKSVAFQFKPGQIINENIPRPEYPRPELYREPWMTLNGYWEFAFDFSDSGEEAGRPQGKGFDRIILVPFAPESELSGIGFLDFMPAVWYKRTFTLPANWAGKKVLLHFEACDYETTVWINGQKVGTHEGGYTPFYFDITAYLQPEENIIIVRARDDVRSGRQATGKQSHRLESYSCLYRRTTGIWQTVWLEAIPEIFVEKLRFYPQKERGEAALLVHFNQVPEKGELILRLNFQGKEVFRVSVPAEKITYIPVKIAGVKLWGIKEPNLYEAEITYFKGKEVIDRVKSYFGFRTIEVRGNRIFLNGQPVFLRQVLDQGFYPDGIYTAPSDEALRRDIELAQSFGFNGARLHQKVFERRYLYWADKMGFLVWGEFPDWGLDLSRGENFLAFQKQWREVLDRDFNHPSIIGWCPFNERWETIYPGFIEEIFHLTKELDPTRLVIDASGGYHLAPTDVFDAHNYDQNIQTFSQAFAGLLEDPPRVFVNGDFKRHLPYRGQPYFVSEYGGIWWNPGQKDEKSWGYGARPKSAEEFLERYRQLTQTLLQNPAIAGFCYTQLYDIEQEVNGLCNFERQPKFAPAIIRSINEQVAAIEIKK